MIFKIEIEKPITELDVQNTFVDLIETRTSSSLIRFEVNKEFENDDDDEDKNNIVPFNIAYALSIHKAQGLEYNSVKVVLTKDVEKLITSNIFYTAITRAKKDLKIFWTAETEKYIINQEIFIYLKINIIKKLMNNFYPSATHQININLSIFD